MLSITGVNERSRAYKAGIREGHRLISINGRPVHDQFDIAFLSTESCLTLSFKNFKTVRLSSDFLRDIVFEPMRARRCGCNCIFCFIDQLPGGLRRSLYHKDEDYRFSYLYGNYVTLGNLSAGDAEKIVRYRLSPLYISVHATDRKIRDRMLGIKCKEPILDRISFFAKNRIFMQCQIVLCPGINDGGILDMTIEDLSRYHPYVESVAVVPVGLTRHRKGLPALKGHTGGSARKTCGQIEKHQKRFLRTLGTRFVFASDEFYVKAGKRIPSHDSYESFAQYENGVGIIRNCITDAEKFFKKVKIRPLRYRGKIAVVTGQIAFKYLHPLVRRLKAVTTLDIRLVPVENTLFGSSVTVAGLVAGKDILKAVGRKNFDHLFIPDVMLREKQDTFLDDVTLRELRDKTNAAVIPFSPDLSGLYAALKKEFL